MESDRVVAKQRRGARGSGKAVIAADAPWSERARYDLFQEFIPDRAEYRVSVLNGRVVSAYAKQPPTGANLEHLRPEWTHQLVTTLPAAVVATAREGARRIGLDLHGLRHTHATLLLEEGVDVKTLSERLGHDSVQTTLELYGHVTPKMRGNAAARFGSLLNSARVAPVAAITAES